MRCQATKVLGLTTVKASRQLNQRLAAGDFEYAFKHALTRQVAYDSMLADRRKALHERAATTIEALYSRQIDDWVDVLAHHYGRTSNTAKTVEYLFRSGQRAAQRFAFEEGIASLKQALELLKSVPEDQQRLRLELRIQNSLLLLWEKVRSVGSAEIRPPLERRVELCEQLGDGTELFRSLLELSTSCIVSGELPKAHQVARRNLNLAEESRRPTILSFAHMSLAQVLSTKGELAAAEDHFEQGVSFAEADSRSGGLGASGFPFFLSLMAQNLWLLGYPDRALASAKEVITLARSQRDEWFGWTAPYYALLVLLWRRDFQALDDANQLLTFVTERGFNIESSQITVGAALIDRGRLAEGVAQIEHAEQGYVRFKLHGEGRHEHELIEATA